MGVPEIDLEEFPDPGDRYTLGGELGSGAFGKVIQAEDTAANGKKIAIKIQKREQEVCDFIRREYVVLRDFCQNVNLVEFYGIFCRKETNEIWFVMEVCSLLFVIRRKSHL